MSDQREARAGAVAPSTRGVEHQTPINLASKANQLRYSSAGGQDRSLREEMVAAAAPEAKRTVNALCDLRQMHLGDFSGDHARGGR